MGKTSARPGTHDFYDVNGDDLSQMSDSLAHAAAMIGHTYEGASYVGFQRMTEDEQKDYLWAIHCCLKVARKRLGKVMFRARYDSAALAVAGEEGSDD